MSAGPDLAALLGSLRHEIGTLVIRVHELSLENATLRSALEQAAALQAGGPR